MRKILILGMAIIILTTSCTQYVLVPLPIPGTDRPAGSTEPVSVLPTDTADPDWYRAGATTLTVADAGDLLALQKAADRGLLNNVTITIERDFDLSSISWNPAASGNRDTVTHVFSGVIDGGGHTITGLKIKEERKVSAGFIGNANNLTVRNLTFENAVIDSAESDSAGIVAGYVTGSLTLDNVHITSGSITAADGTGGLIGRAYAADTGDRISIKNVSNDADIISPVKTGGIIGAISALNSTAFSTVTMENVSNSGDITSESGAAGIGGIVGYSAATAVLNMSEVSNSGSITARGTGADDTAGGIIGIIVAAEKQTGTISGATNTGAIYGGYQAGGIIGRTQGENTSMQLVLQDPINEGSVGASTERYQTGENTYREPQAGGITASAVGTTIINGVNKGAITGYYAGGIAGIFTGRQTIENPSGGNATITGERKGRIAGRVNAASTATLAVDNEIVGDLTDIAELGRFEGQNTRLHLTSGNITVTPTFAGAQDFFLKIDNGASFALESEWIHDEYNKVYEGPCSLAIINGQVTEK